VVGAIAILTTFTYGCVVAVFFRTAKLRNSQGIYKLSLGITDCLVGVLVLPAFCYQLIVVSRPHNPAYLNGTQGNSSGTLTSQLRFDLLFDARFTKISDSIRSLLLFTSYFTLILASADRLKLVWDPFKYSAVCAKRFAVKAVISTWLVAVVLAIFVFPRKRPINNFVATITMSPKDSQHFSKHFCFLFIPLVLMWAITVATCYYAFSHARDREGSNYVTEVQLTRVLIVMVFVFTLGVLPGIIVVFVSFSIPEIYFDQPATLNTGAAAAYTSCELIAQVLTNCNSSWNFFVYNARSEKFREAFRTIFCRKDDVYRTNISSFFKMTTTRNT